MAEIRYFRNPFGEDFETKEYDFSKSLVENIDGFKTNVTEMVECYDTETGETYFVPLEDDEEHVIVTVNGKSVDENYEVQSNDVLVVVYIPLNSDVGRGGNIGLGAIVGALLGLVAVAILNPFAGSALFALSWGWYAAGALVGGLLGAAVGAGVYDKFIKGPGSSTTLEDKTGEQRPDVRGAENESLAGNPYPFIMGRHLIAPRIAGDPYTEYSGSKGENAYVRVLYNAGYAPVKLTDFKLGEIFLAYNRTQGSYNDTPTGAAEGTRPVMLNGILHGHSKSGDDADTGDIVDYWQANDISIELIQQNPNKPTNYGTIYPNKAVEQEINATPLFVCDELLSQTAQVVYKGASFPQNFRNNGVYFTDACPMKFTINLNAQSGLYASRSMTDKNKDGDTVNSTEYSSIPLWYCIQWRPYNKNNPSSDSNGNDCGSWKNITVWNDIDKQDVYDSTEMGRDKTAHAGNEINYKDVLWKDKKPINNLEDLKNYWTTVVKIKSDIKLTQVQGFYVLTIGQNFIAKLPYQNDFYFGKLNQTDTRTDGSDYNAAYDTVNKILYIDAYNDISSTDTLCAEWIDGFEYFSTDENTKSFTLYKQGESRVFNDVKQVVVAKRYFFGSQTTKQSISGAWVDRTLTNFKDFSGENFKGQTRLRATVDLTQVEGFDFSQLMNPDNTTKSIEIRVLRVSASYLNEEQSTTKKDDVYPKYGAYSYSDVITVDTIVTEPFDEGWYREHNEIIPQKVQSESDMKKFAYIAIKAKADVTNIQSQLKKLTCMAESFSPVWDMAEKKWLPEGVERIKNYYAYVEISDTPTTSPVWSNIYFKETDGIYERVYYDTYVSGTEVYEVEYKNRGEDNSEEVTVTQSTYEDGRGEGFDWYCEEAGSNFGDLIKQEVFPSDDSRRDTHNGVARDYMLETDDAAKFNDSTSASSFMLACVGQQDGRWADGYKDINLLSVGEWWEDCQAVEDGSTYDYNDGVHKTGDTVVVKYEANGYITASQKKESLLKDIAATGRSVFTYDEAGRIKVVMDKPVDYAEGVINSQNCIEESHAYSFADIPPGLRIAYSDENDGYEQGSMYCWADGYNLSNYRGTVEACSLKYVTNPYHAHNLGRYILACRVMKKQVMTAKVGREGRLFPLGAVVLVQSDEILLGEGSARIQEVLTKEEDGQTVVCGIVTDNVFNFKNEEKNGHSTKGVQILQPKQFGKSKVVTLRLKRDGDTETIDGVTYTQKSGAVNLFLFDSGEENVVYDFKTGDIVMLGTIDKISQKFRVIKVKPEEKGSFTMTLNLYDEALYNYGAKLPVFKVNTTRPPVIDTMPALSEVASTVDEQERIVNKAITLTVNDTPDVFDIDTDIKEITVTTDRDARAVTDQQSTVTIHCIINNTDVYFLIAEPTIGNDPIIDKGWRYTVDPATKKITFIIPKGTIVGKGTINIPIYYGITQQTVIYWDENFEQYTDGTTTYSNLPLENYTLKTLYVTYAGVEGGMALGPISSISGIPTEVNINDYFVWSGDNATQSALVVGGYLYTARLYRYNGNSENPKWETDEDISHNSAQLGEIIKAANVVLTSEQLQDNNIQAWTFIKNLAVSNLFVDFMVANTAVIQSLSTGVITTGSLITESAAKTYSDEEVASSQDNLAQKLGYANYADMVSKSAQVGTVVTNDGFLRTNLIDTDDLFAKNIKLKQDGSISSDNYVLVRDDAEKIISIEYHCLTVAAYSITNDITFSTFTEAQTYYNNHSEIDAYGIKVVTDKDNTYYVDNYTNMTIFRILYSYFNKDDGSDITSYSSFGLEDLDLNTNKYVCFLTSGTAWLERDTSKQIILHEVKEEGFFLPSNGNARFINATIEAADFKLNVEAGNVEQLTLPISKPDTAQTQFDYEFKPMGTGSFRIKFNYTIQEHISESVGNDLLIYINGVICEFEDTTPGTYTYTQDITFNAGDVIKISVYYAYDRLVLDPTIINSAKVFLATDSTMFKTMSNCALVSYWTSGHR